jgi:hypothetical protein
MLLRIGLLQIPVLLNFLVVTISGMQQAMPDQLIATFAEMHFMVNKY